MLKTLGIIYLIGIVPSFVFLWGATFSYFQKKYPLTADDIYYKELVFCISWSLHASFLWIFFVPYIYFDTNKLEHGFKWW